MTNLAISDYLAIQNEKLFRCLNKSIYNPNVKVILFYHQVAKNEEESESRKKAQLVNTIKGKCHKYLEYADNSIQNKVLYLFGEETKKGNEVESIYENICVLIQNNKDMEMDGNMISPYNYFTNIRYSQFCSLCLKMDGCHKTSIMKKYAIGQRSNVSLKQHSKLTFTILHEGISVCVKLTTDCVGCCPPSVRFNISSNPEIEDINTHQQLLIDNPIQFVEMVVIGWVANFFQARCMISEM